MNNNILTAESLTSRLKKLDKKGNKGTNGTLTVIAGSDRFRGAADLAVGGALRTGCGIVRLLSIEKVVSLVACRHPSAVFSPEKEGVSGAISAEAKTDIASLSKKSDAFLVGPGLSVCADSAALLSAVLDFSYKTVIDADAINIISQNKELLNTFKGQKVITPHVGELSRLSGLSIAEIKEKPEMAAREFSLKNNCVTVLKDYITYISSESGELFESRLGCEGLSKGGSGDVLSGMIAGFLAAGYNALDSAIIGTVLHGLASAKCAENMGKRGMLPSDLEAFAAFVLKELGY